jgi:hypothetical protein
MDPADPLFASTRPAPFFVTSTEPPSNAIGVPTNAIVDVGLSDVPWPGDLARAWNLHTGGIHVTATASIDLVDRRVRVRAARGFEPGWQYSLELTPALHSFAGAPLQGIDQLSFTTGRMPSAPSPPAAPVSLVEDVLPALDQCAQRGCHDTQTSAGELDLGTAAGALGGVGRRSLYAPSATLIVPGSHAQSYLVWKALGLPRTVGHRSPQVPPLSHDDARRLADWIDAGARQP